MSSSENSNVMIAVCSVVVAAMCSVSVPYKHPLLDCDCTQNLGSVQDSTAMEPAYRVTVSNIFTPFTFSTALNCTSACISDQPAPAATEANVLQNNCFVSRDILCRNLWAIMAIRPPTCMQLGQAQYHYCAALHYVIDSSVH
eukprot:8316-Heterococcus_DN1.PRE.4